MGRSYHLLDLGGGIPQHWEIYPKMQFPMTRIVAEICQGMN